MSVYSKLGYCALFQRRLQGQRIRGEAYYRCRYPAEYAAVASDFDHPKSVYLREVDLVGRLDDWLAELFSPANLDHTCRILATASRNDPADDQRRAAQQVLVDCQRRLDRYRAALEAGTDPAVITRVDRRGHRHPGRRRISTPGLAHCP